MAWGSQHSGISHNAVVRQRPEGFFTCGQRWRTCTKAVRGCGSKLQQVARDGPPLTSLRCFFAVLDGPHPILLLRRSAASPSNFVKKLIMSSDRIVKKLKDNESVEIRIPTSFSSDVVYVEAKMRGAVRRPGLCCWAGGGWLSVPQASRFVLLGVALLLSCHVVENNAGALPWRHTAGYRGRLSPTTPSPLNNDAEPRVISLADDTADAAAITASVPTGVAYASKSSQVRAPRSPGHACLVH